MKPQALLAIWHDVETDYVAEYLRWHTFEHLPERLALPGFRRARRLEREDGPGQRFLCLIEVEALSDFESPDYLARLNAPTDWTRRLMPRYGRVHRALCSLILDEGGGVAPIVECVRFSPSDDALPSGFVETVLDMRRNMDLAHAQIATVRGDVGAQATEEKRLRRGEDSGGFTHLLVMAGLAAQPLRRAADRIETVLAASVRKIERTTYRHSFASRA